MLENWHANWNEIYSQKVKPNRKSIQKVFGLATNEYQMKLKKNVFSNNKCKLSKLYNVQ